jgi:methionyl-tRNA formyltransferase
MRLLFLGTPAFAVPSLHAVAGTSHTVAAVITQPDRPRGRGHKVSPSPVKDAATALGIPVLQPTRLKDPALHDQLRAFQPDLGIVVAYGRILPGELLALPRLGMINVHASLLPRWRGAAPIQRAILAGDRETGVTIMRVVQELDAGPMLALLPTSIEPNETSIDLEQRLATLGAGLLVEALEAIGRGPVTETPQEAAHVTYAAKIERRDGQIGFDVPATQLHDAIRGLQPWPLVWSRLHGKRIAFLASEVDPTIAADVAPATVLRVETDAIVVATKDAKIRIRRVQLEGRGPVAVRDFLNGHPTKPGDRFESTPVTEP